jgi:hypothetical protein
MRGNHSYCYLLKMEMKNSTLFLTDAAHDITHGGAVWLSNGWLQYIDGIENSSETKKGELKLGFDAVDPSMIAFALNGEYKNRLCELYTAMLGDNGQVIPDPLLTWVGEMIGHGIGDTDKTPIVTLDVNGAFSQINKSNPWRTTVESHQRRRPGDYCFYESVANQAEVEWGGAK